MGVVARDYKSTAFHLALVGNYNGGVRYRFESQSGKEDQSAQYEMILQVD